MGFIFLYQYFMGRKLPETIYGVRFITLHTPLEIQANTCIADQWTDLIERREAQLECLDEMINLSHSEEVTVAG